MKSLFGPMYLSVEGLLLIFILAQWETTFIGYVLREIL